LKNKATTITGPRKTDNGELVIDIGTPAYTGGEAVGRLNATIGNEELKKMYTSNSLQGDAGLTLFMRDGMVLTNISNRIMKVKEQENLYKHFNNENVHFTLNSPQGIAEDVQNGRSGWVKYWHNGHSTCIYYKPFGINDWYMAISATDNTLEMQAGDIKAHGNMLTAAVLITVCLVAVIVMIQRVKEQERMDALKNTYSVAIRKTNDLFYEADIDSDELIDRSESGEKAVWKETPKNYSNALTQIANVCAPECRQQFLDTFLPQNIKIRIKEGISSINFEYKITPDENTVRWLSATLVPVVDNQNKSTKLICMENDITEEMLHRERLKRSATLDGLTGLYNKITTQNYIDQFLLTEGKDGHHALLIIDIDSFKSINDNLGHAKGDEVLRDCGDALRKIFRKNDIVGRIGGDEFAVLIKDYGVIELVKSKCEEICRGFYKEQSLEDDKKIKVTTSASIGAAFYSEHGKN
ncbi:MAG: diguanylate cyclase, partial [Oscillospiraceae bacterium]